MTKFTDGPARGQMLMLKRSPLYLRVVREGKKFDGLDQLTDAPAAGETIVAVYRLVSIDGYAMVDWTENGKRRGGCFPSATYAVCPEQPDDATARDTSRWREWCYAQQRKAKGSEA